MKKLGRVLSCVSAEKSVILQSVINKLECQGCTCLQKQHNNSHMWLFFLLLMQKAKMWDNKLVSLKLFYSYFPCNKRQNSSKPSSVWWFVRRTTVWRVLVDCHNEVMGRIKWRASFVSTGNKQTELLSTINRCHGCLQHIFRPIMMWLKIRNKIIDINGSTGLYSVKASQTVDSS